MVLTSSAINLTDEIMLPTNWIPVSSVADPFNVLTTLPINCILLVTSPIRLEIETIVPNNGICVVKLAFRIETLLTDPES